MFEFWQKWLAIAGGLIAAVGLLIALNLNPGALDELINPVFFKGAGPSLEMAAFQGWIYGVLGSVMLSWGVLITFLATHAFKAKQKWAHRAISVAVISWYIVDTVISFTSGAMFNVVGNTIFLIVLGLPLVFTIRDFK